jgi:ABC-type Fe3+-hydroxamate transport system substrate-binding protein
VGLSQVHLEGVKVAPDVDDVGMIRRFEPGDDPKAFRPLIRLAGIPIFEQRWIVVRPPQARREKPRVSAFTSANIDKILALKPDLVLMFSDLQADIAADLIRRGLDVHAFNQRSIAGLLHMIRTLGAMIDASERARQLAGTLESRLAEARNRAERLPKRPRYSSRNGTIR